MINFASAGFSASYLDNNLISYYDFEDGTGTTATDIAGDYNLLSNSSTWTTGKNGSYAMNFSASSSQFARTVSNITQIDNINYTINGWIKLNLNKGSQYANVYKVGINTLPASIAGCHDLDSETGNSLWNLNTDGTLYSDGSSSDDVGTFVMMTMRYDANANNLTLWRNGVLVTTGSITTDASAGELWLGKRCDGYSGAFGVFQADEISIWNRTLNTTEIATDLYANSDIYTVNTDPTITINYPIDNQNLSSSSITFMTIPRDAEDASGLNVSIYGNWTGSWHLNTSNTSSLNNTQTNFTISAIPDGEWIWGARVGDTDGSSVTNTTNYTFTKDTVAPTITLPFYTNGTLKKNTDTLTLNISITDATTSPSACKIDINGTNQTFAVSSGWCNITNGFLTNLADGNRTINVYANDTLNTFGVNNSFVVFIDSISPVAEFGTNPANNINRSNSSVTFEIRGYDGIEIHGLRLYGNWTGSWVANQTNTTPVNATYWNVTIDNIPQGEWIWAGWVNDTTGNEDLTDTNRTITIDTVAPVITLPFYTNATKKTSTTDTLTLNISITDATTSPSACKIDINGTNQTFAVSSGWCNITNGFLTNLADGNRTINVYANDSTGQFGLNNSFIVSIHTVPPTIVLNSPADKNISSTRSIIFNATATASNSNMKNISLWTNSTGTWHNNQTITFSSANSLNISSNITANTSIGTINWSEPFKADISDDGYASATVDLTITYYLKATNFNFTIPDGATIMGIEAIVEAKRTGVVGVTFNSVKILKGYIGSTEKSTGTALTTSDANYTYGSSTYLWGETWTPGNINNSNFGWVVSFTNLGSQGIVSVDAMWIKVYYSAPSFSSQTFSLTVPEGGNTTWNAEGCDDDNFCNLSVSNYTVTADTQTPTISLPFYTNGTLKKNTDTLTLNISVSDATTNPSTCKIDINGTNQTVTVSSGWCNITNGFLTNLAEGNRTINVYANDTVNNWGLNNSFVVFMNDDPIVTLPFYTNGTLKKNTDTLTLNVSVSDASPGLSGSSCKIDINGTNQTVSVSSGWCNITNGFLTNLADGNQTIRVYANDSTGQFGLNSSFVVFMDSTLPLITFNPSTSTSTIYNQNFIFVNISVTENNFQNITYYLYNSTNSTLNTTSSNTLFTTLNFTSLSQGTYYFNVTVFDRFVNENTSLTQQAILSPPDIDIRYINTTEGSQTINFFVNNLSFVVSCRFTILNSTGQVDPSTQAGTFFTCGQNAQDSLSSFGSYVFLTTANDSIGRENTLSKSFSLSPINVGGGGGGGGSTPTTIIISENFSISERNVDKLILFFQEKKAQLNIQSNKILKSCEVISGDTDLFTCENLGTYAKINFTLPKYDFTINEFNAKISYTDLSNNNEFQDIKIRAIKLSLLLIFGLTGTFFGILIIYLLRREIKQKIKPHYLKLKKSYFGTIKRKGKR